MNDLCSQLKKIIKSCEDQTIPSEFRSKHDRLSFMRQEGVSVACTFSEEERKFANKIIKIVNSDTIVINRNETIENKEHIYIVHVMVHMILFMLKSDFSPSLEGNDFKKISKKLEDIEKILQTKNNQSYLRYDPAVLPTLKALQFFFESNQKKSAAGTNFLAHEIGKEIMHTWRLIGHSEAFYQEQTETEKANMTGLAVFIESIRTTFEEIMSENQNSNNTGFQDLVGLDYSIRLIRDGKIKL